MSIRTTKIASILLSALLGLAATTASAQTSTPSPTPVAEFEEFTDLDQEVAPGWTMRDLLEAEPIEEVIDLDKENTSELEPATTPDPSIYVSPSFLNVSPDLIIDGKAVPVTTGRVFSRLPGSDKAHTCTGSVVNSENGGIVMTAAHCLYAKNKVGEEPPKFETEGHHHSVFFIPGYYEYTQGGILRGRTRFGIWHEVSRSIHPEWLANRTDGHDQAFLTVRADTSGPVLNLRDYVGANGMILNADPEMDVVVAWGYGKKLAEYPPVDYDSPAYCQESAAFANQNNNLVGLYCPTAIGGWSGGPWLHGDQSTAMQGWLVGNTSGTLQGNRIGGAWIDNSAVQLYEEEVAKGN